MFVANRDRVRSWLDDWDFPEVAWPMASAIPSPWVVAPGPQQMWWQDGDAEATHRWLLRRRAVMRDDRVRWSGNALVILRSIDRRGLQQTLNAMGTRTAAQPVIDIATSP